MRDAGYIYVNIDDTWEGKRDEKGVLHSNEKFPDMKALAGYVHSKGLKLGIYSSPGPKTCAQFEGSYQHEAQDAKQVGHQKQDEERPAPVICRIHGVKDDQCCGQHLRFRETWIGQL